MRLFVSALALLMSTLVSQPSVAGATSEINGNTSRITYSAIPMIRAERGSLLQQIQGYECRACRQSCYRDFKLDCDNDEDDCRSGFVQCMRQCWESECR
jgi:hypothetical protein